MTDKKFYLAGPMSGYVDCNVPAFLKARERLTEAGYNIVLPFDIETQPEATEENWKKYIGDDIRLVNDADGIIFLPQWQYSRGAKLEAMAGLMQKVAREFAFAFLSYTPKGGLVVNFQTADRVALLVYMNWDKANQEGQDYVLDAETGYFECR